MIVRIYNRAENGGRSLADEHDLRVQDTPVLKSGPPNTGLIRRETRYSIGVGSPGELHTRRTSGHE